MNYYYKNIQQQLVQFNTFVRLITLKSPTNRAMKSVFEPNQSTIYVRT